MPIVSSFCSNYILFILLQFSHIGWWNYLFTVSWGCILFTNTSGKSLALPSRCIFRAKLPKWSAGHLVLEKQLKNLLDWNSFWLLPTFTGSPARNIHWSFRIGHQFLWFLCGSTCEDTVLTPWPGCQCLTSNPHWSTEWPRLACQTAHQVPSCDLYLTVADYCVMRSGGWHLFWRPCACLHSPKSTLQAWPRLNWEKWHLKTKEMPSFQPKSLKFHACNLFFPSLHFTCMHFVPRI